MKLSKLKNRLEEKNFNKIRKIRTTFKTEKNKLDDLKIIGITGSRGKSTTAYIVHEYLKSLGYKSVLYSSIMVDSPASHIRKNEAQEVAVGSENALLSIINEVENYGADFLVLEVNDSTLAKGFVNDVPFDVRVLTNLNPKHNLEQYSEEEYITLKKSFFEDISENSKCVIGFQNYEKELFEELISLNECEKLTFSSNYVAIKKGLNPEEITCLLNSLENTLDGLKMGVKVNEENTILETNVMMSHNALNFVCAFTVLKALEVLDTAKLNKCIKDIKLPGRAEIYNVNKRLIIVDAQMTKMLESLKEFKDQEKINQIKVVTGSIGSGYIHWEEIFNTGKHYNSRHTARQYACGILKQYADLVYLTENDNGAESVRDISIELQNNLEGLVPSIIIEDREAAIRQAILESNEGDAIFISGRGNRRVLCNSATTMKLIKDSEVVEKVLKELGW